MDDNFFAVNSVENLNKISKSFRKKRESTNSIKS